ncbi:SDR family oxidoreductase [Glutamicibacter mishrai]|uniref:SDR family NAD(P)-dependent oxidoreductase n=1 Tax=Glutamicibacter mishrai TaxID=1775880 RepID=UPI0020CC6E22|nr:SDR family oxidoreductase [Glutamicibacter mishrai]UTT40442.1 SDR family oxidoreductase [Glutamicibacter mishrai]
MERLENRRVIVTGGGSGIGQATVLRMLREGGRVVAADVSEAGLEDTRQKAGDMADRLKTVIIDVSKEQSVKDGVAEAAAWLGGLDALVNAAGILRSSHTEQTSTESIKHLRDGKLPSVVNFSSTSAMFAHPYMSAYAASKGGIQSMTHALASEFAKDGIRFTAVQPGSISSGMTDGSGASQQSVGPGLPKDADMSLFMKLSPALGQGFGGADAVANVVAMLASEEGYFITGTEIRIDGGTHF